MKAILIAQENRELILESVDGINERIVTEWLSEAAFETRYFVPVDEYTGDDEGVEHVLCVTYPKELFEMTFNFDQQGIKTNFVDCFRK